LSLRLSNSDYSYRKEKATHFSIQHHYSNKYRSIDCRLMYNMCKPLIPNYIMTKRINSLKSNKIMDQSTLSSLHMKNIYSSWLFSRLLRLQSQWNQFQYLPIYKCIYIVELYCGFICWCNRVSIWVSIIGFKNTVLLCQIILIINCTFILYRYSIWEFWLWKKWPDRHTNRIYHRSTKG